MSALLGDSFSKQLKEKLTDIDISLKTILLIEIPEFIQAKGKKFAILIVQSNCNSFIGMVSINTNKPFSGNFYTLTKSQYSFLDYDSHVGCDVICERSIDEMRKFLINNPKYIKGEITDFQHIQILQKLTESKVITPVIKKKYGLL